MQPAAITWSAARGTPLYRYRQILVHSSSGMWTMISAKAAVSSGQAGIDRAIGAVIYCAEITKYFKSVRTNGPSSTDRE
jgi:hypothetical protein